MLRCILTALFLTVFTTASFADENEMVIGNVMSDNASEHYTAVVDKSQKKLYLLKIKGDKQEVIDNITILTGGNDGSKQFEGDKRTPEGIYYITSYMDDTTLLRKYGKYAEIYGTGAYPTNYPNPIDKAYKRTGHGIWLHGLSPDRHKPATEGCVAMQNEDLDRIKSVLAIDVPLVIIDNASFMPPEEYEETRKKHLNELNIFINAWSTGEYDTFKEYVHPKYVSYAASNAATYLAAKKQLMQLYPDKVININNINVYRQNDNTLVYDLDQFYCAPNITTYGNKRYYLINDNNTHKLISEEIFAKPVRGYLDNYILSFVESWKNAWESKDIETYSKFYSSSIAGKNQWKENKTSLFDTTSTISVDIENVKWEQAVNNTISITFLQNYKSDQTKDRGYKTLVLKGCPGNYTIESESWRSTEPVRTADTTGSVN